MRVEVDVSPGLPSFDIVGLPGATVRESRDRVRAAIRNSGYDFPLHRVTVNLAPATMRKEGALFDLPIAVGVLVASNQLDPALSRGWLIAGELSLDGATRGLRGALSVGLLCRTMRRKLLIPEANASEAGLVSGLQCAVVRTLGEVQAKMAAGPDWGQAMRKRDAGVQPSLSGCSEPGDCVDLADVIGQARAKRALEISAAGGHSLLLVGPPGAGKTMLARRLPGLLPGLEWEEALMVTRIHSVAGLLPDGASLITKRPFRAPFHTTTLAGLIGGGANPKPGEVSLAHRGVLFMDEFAEWPAALREALRQPLEDGKVTLSRAGVAVTFPAEPILVLASNPCPCGFAGDADVGCKCRESERSGYRQRLSGPILDRVDLRVEVERLAPEDLTAGPACETTAAVRTRVERARAWQLARLGRSSDGTARLNAHLSSREVAGGLALTEAARRLAAAAVGRYRLTARGFHRVQKVARTIADLCGSEAVEVDHLAEALQYRWSPESP